MPNQGAPKQSTRRYIYDLYAVSNHMGSLNGGHYTAYCKNSIFNKWFEYDDSHVQKIGTTAAEVKDTVWWLAAYVLFYKLRK